MFVFYPKIFNAWDVKILLIDANVLNIVEIVNIVIINAVLYNVHNMFQIPVVLIHFIILALFPDKCIWHSGTNMCLIICAKLDEKSCEAR